MSNELKEFLFDLILQAVLMTLSSLVTTAFPDKPLHFFLLLLNKLKYFSLICFSIDIRELPFFPLPQWCQLSVCVCARVLLLYSLGYVI